MFVSTTAENLVSLSALFTQLHSDFHSLYILEFHGKAVNCYNIKLSMSVLFCKKTNIPPGRFYGGHSGINDNDSIKLYS